MAEQYVSFVVTNAGEDIITRIIAGLNVTFKRFAIGDGFDYGTDNFVVKEGLINEVKSLDIKTIQVTNSNNVELTAEFGTGDIEDSFYFRELGIYVIDPDDENNEILFAYGNRNDAAEYITPHIQNYAVLKNIKCLVRVGSSANVNILVTTTQSATAVNFDVTEWQLDDNSGLYSLNVGSVSNCLKIFKTTDNGRIDTALVDIIKDNDDITVLRAIAPFTGCVLCS